MNVITEAELSANDEYVISTKPRNSTIVALIKTGAHMYGTETEDSDSDYKGIYIPSTYSAITNGIFHIEEKNTSAKAKKNDSSDIDITWISLPRFGQLIARSDMNSIDMLHANDKDMVVTSDVWKHLAERRNMTYSTDMAGYDGVVKSTTSSFNKVGYYSDRVWAMEEFYRQFIRFNYQKSDLTAGDFADWMVKAHEPALYELRDRDIYEADDAAVFMFGLSADRSEPAVAVKKMIHIAYKWKPVHHAFRILYQLRSIYQKNEFEYPLAETNFLVDVKRGKLPYGDVHMRLMALIREVQILKEGIDAAGEFDDCGPYDWANYTETFTRAFIIMAIRGEQNMSLNAVSNALSF